jgi:hypothetical protein
MGRGDGLDALRRVRGVSASQGRLGARLDAAVITFFETPLAVRGSIDYRAISILSSLKHF